MHRSTASAQDIFSAYEPTAGALEHSLPGSPFNHSEPASRFRCLSPAFDSVIDGWARDAPLLTPTPLCRPPLYPPSSTHPVDPPSTPLRTSQLGSSTESNPHRIDTQPNTTNTWQAPCRKAPKTPSPSTRPSPPPSRTTATTTTTRTTTPIPRLHRFKTR